MQPTCAWPTTTHHQASHIHSRNRAPRQPQTPPHVPTTTTQHSHTSLKPTPHIANVTHPTPSPQRDPSPVRGPPQRSRMRLQRGLQLRTRVLPRPFLRHRLRLVPGNPPNRRAPTRL